MLPQLLAAGSPRVVGVNLADMTALAAAEAVADPDGEAEPGASSSQSRDVSPESGFLSTPGAADALAKMEPGACMLHLVDHAASDGEAQQFIVPVVCWKGWGSLALYV